MRSPRRVETAAPNSTVEAIAQQIIFVNQSRKRELLSFLIGSEKWEQVLVFTRTKHGANRLAAQLETDGILAAAIHGNKSQGARTRALADFKARKVQVLVATDIAARGIDIAELPHVVNYDIPNVPEDYVHRIGRTGRAGREGLAVSLVCSAEKALLRDIKRLVKVEIPTTIIAGYEPNDREEAEPPRQPNRSRPAAPRARTNDRTGDRSGPRSGARPAARPGAGAAVRGSQRGSDRGSDRGNERGNERGNDRGNERGNARSDARSDDRGNTAPRPNQTQVRRAAPRPQRGGRSHAPA